MKKEGAISDETYRELWEERLDQLDDYLANLKKESGKHEKRK